MGQTGTVGLFETKVLEPSFSWAKPDYTLREEARHELYKHFYSETLAQMFLIS